MRRFSALLIVVLFLGLVLIPVQQYRMQEMREPHPSVTSLDSTIPRINYMEQVRDIRRTLERKPHIAEIHHNERDRSHFVEHEVVVRFSPRPSQAAIDAMLKKAHAHVKRDYGHAMIIKSESLTTKQLMKLFAEHPDSIYAEPNYLLLPNRVPNDILYRRYQWNLPLIGMEQSWNVSRGSGKVVVAIVDTGIDLDHPEFRGKLATGYNVLEDNHYPMDDNGHGTHVAGIIAARTNNRVGIAGMSWNSRLMPVKAIGADGSGTAFDIAQGIRWAADHGADVINLSVGNYTSSAALREACRYAYDKNVVLVAATGNDATDQPGYPAAYREVFGVSAVDHNRNRADFSNYGDYVDVVAPGVDIASTYIYSDYAALSGTSMACPHVAALASLIRSVNPDLSSEQVMNIMRSTARDLGRPGKDPLYGYGLIDVNAAVHQAKAMAKLKPNEQPLQVQPPGVGGLLNRFLHRLRFGL
ncbi:S8 family peptidase [Brevibacillus sp. SYP-B805]|uniref:S8 family peptidase n=1 Tax=Brevibacillus sp. SYP-B805 TaxID=1578199 RepID=UPI001F49E336|nr:S8 family peptidase [Brevibacillus sp. SYP-B805]